MRSATRLRPLPVAAIRPLTRDAGWACVLWALTCLVLLSGGAVPRLEGYAAAWVMSRAGELGQEAAMVAGLPGLALLLLSSVHPLAVGGGVVVLTLELVAVVKVLQQPQGLLTPNAIGVLVMLAPYVVTCLWIALAWAFPPHHPRNREARQAGLAILLADVLWIAAVRTGMLHRVWHTGDVALVMLVPVGLACLWVAGPTSVFRGLGRQRGRPAAEPVGVPRRPTAEAQRATRAPQPAQVAGLALADVVLPERTRTELAALVKALRDPQAGAALGIEPPQGAVLYGPPGTGKTMIARALAGETNRAMLAYSGAELVSMWVGEGPQLVHAMFSTARRTAPCILFIDELDGIAPARGGSDTGVSAAHDARARMAEFLHALEGVSGPLTGVFVVGASNRLDDIDPAVRSRLGYHVAIPLPDEPARAEILRRLFPPQVTTTPEEIAHLAQGASGRDLRELCRIAGMLALGEGAAAVTRTHFEQALARVAPEPGSHATRASVSSRIAQARFADLALPDSLLAELRTLVRLITDPAAGRDLGVASPAGAILHGPPGVGKTLIARAVAGESDRPVLAFAGAAVTSMWVGEGTQLVRDMFQQARQAAPCILFIDELDGITPSRRPEPGVAFGGASQDATQRINQFLQELEGVGGTAAGVFLIGATNHLDAIDPAVRSRLSYHVAIPMPGPAERVWILRQHFPARTTVSPEDIATLTDGCSGRDLRELCRIAGLIALSEAATDVTIGHFQKALQRLEHEEA